MATLLTLRRPRAARLDNAHSAHLADSIARYRAKAATALENAHQARRQGNELRARGLVDEAATFLAMSQGLRDQAFTTEVRP